MEVCALIAEMIYEWQKNSRQNKQQLREFVGIAIVICSLQSESETGLWLGALIEVPNEEVPFRATGNDNTSSKLPKHDVKNIQYMLLSGEDLHFGNGCDSSKEKILLLLRYK